MRIYGHDVQLIDPEGEIVTDVVVLARTVRHGENGRMHDSLLSSTTKNTTYMVEIGMLAYAAEIAGEDDE